MIASASRSGTSKIVRDGQSVTEVHGRLRAAIQRGELMPGSWVSLGQLARDFEVGRTPLREALRLLQSEGLVIAEPNRRVRIAELSADDFEELSIARLALETVAIRITVPTFTSADIATLGGHLAQMEHHQQLQDEQRLRPPHRAFHAALVAAVGPRVSAEMARLADHTERYRLRFAAAGRSTDRRSRHRSIFDAVAAGNADLAADRLAEHHVYTLRLVFGVLDPGRDLGRVRTAIRALAPGAEAALEG